MTKQEFFTCCENCGSIEWIETIKTSRLDSRGNNVTEERVNELTREGEMKFPWKIDIYVFNKFSEMKMSEKKFYEKKRWFNEKYEDIVCFNCEKRLNPIPFSDIDKKQRISIFFMSSQDRIDFAKNYKMVKVIERG
jgi:hypothetical protein